MVDFAKLLHDGPPPPPRVPGLVLGVTGHRPHKLHSRLPIGSGSLVAVDGYEWGNPLRCALRLEVEAATRRLVESHWCDQVDRMRAAHVDSYLRTVRWSPEWAAEADGGGPRWRWAPVVCLTGCAIGVDQDAAGVWRRMGLPYVAVVPFHGQEDAWPAEAQRVYRAVLARAAGVVYASTETSAALRASGPGAVRDALLRRNEWIWCPSDELISVWDGSQGGTAHCTRNFETSGRRATRIDVSEVRARLGDW